MGLVLGGSQALSRSLYSQLIPHGKEAEYFSLYQAMERGTSWFGTAHLRTRLPGDPVLPGSAILALIVFFVRRRHPAVPRQDAPRALSTRATRCRASSDL
ncbi:MAG: MFS transporter [Dermatophilaceae bacterium]